MTTETDTDNHFDVTDNPAEGRFEIRVDGQLAGLTQYLPRSGAVAFPHTQIDEAYAGQGLATRLIRSALDTMRERGQQVLPYCPFVQGFIRKHPDYLDLVPADRRAGFDLAAAAE